jgi:hypothetical protein
MKKKLGWKKVKLLQVIGGFGFGLYCKEEVVVVDPVTEPSPDHRSPSNQTPSRQDSTIGKWSAPNKTVSVSVSVMILDRGQASFRNQISGVLLPPQLSTQLNWQP